MKLFRHVFSSLAVRGIFSSRLKAPVSRKRSSSVLAHIYRSPHRIAVGDTFECVSDAGSFIMVRAAAAQLRALYHSSNISGEKFSLVAPDNLVTLLFEKQRVNRVISRVGDFDVPLTAYRYTITLRLRLRAWRCFRKQLAYPRRDNLVIARHHHVWHNGERVVAARYYYARRALQQKIREFYAGDA